MAKRSFDESMDQGSRTKTRQAKNIYVSFSKRRKSLFRKASELCTNCNAQIAVFVLSPTGNPFAFGHSSVNSVLRRFLGQTTPTDCRFITYKQRCQAEQVERLKLRVKELGQKPESKMKAWIEKEWEACSASTTSLEELELLNRKYFAVLAKIRKRLSCLGKEEKDDLLDGCPVAVVNSSDDMSYSEEKLGIICADYVDTSIKKGLRVGSSSSSFVGEAEKAVYGGFPGGHPDLIDVCPRSVVDSSNDKSYSMDKFGTTFASSVDTSVKEEFGVGSSSFLGEGTSGVGPFNEFVDFESVGMECYSSFYPQIGGYVYPNSSNDMSYSMDKCDTTFANFVNTSIKEGFGVGSSSFLREGTSGVRPFNEFVDFESVGMECYSSFFPQIGGYVYPISVMNSSNDMSYSGEKFGANTDSGDTSIKNGLGIGSSSSFIGEGTSDGVGPFNNFLDFDSLAVASYTTHFPQIGGCVCPLVVMDSSVEFSDTNFGRNYNVEGISDDEVFDYLGRVDFNLFPEYSL